jgi:hypothetical protein
MNYIILRLTTGEQIMATFDSEDNTHLEISYPMVVRMTPIQADGRLHEQVTAVPFCQFSDEKNYRLPKTCIMFYKKLHEILVPHYLGIVEAYEETVLIKPKQHDRKLRWDDEEEQLSVEDIKRKVDDITAFFEGSTSEENQEIESIFVEGNDTKH